MEIKKFEVKNPSELLMMLANVLASAESKQQAEEEPLPPVTVTEAKGINDYAIDKEVIIRNWVSIHWNTISASLRTTGKTHQLVQLVLVGKCGLMVWKSLSSLISNKLVDWQLAL